jgi:hypothetical protein
MKFVKPLLAAVLLCIAAERSAVAEDPFQASVVKRYAIPEETEKDLLKRRALVGVRDFL